jgi:conjugal transfer ATP-binding protein TraC
METNEVYQLYLRKPLSEYLLPAVYDEHIPAYICRDNTVAIIFECFPKPLAGEDTVRILQNLYSSMYLPTGSVIQVTLWASDYLEPFVNRFAQMRGVEDTLRDESGLVDSVSDFLLSQKRKGYFDELPIPVRNFRLFFTFKLPFQASDYMSKIRDIEIIYRNVKTVLESSYLFPEPVPPDQYINITSLMANPNHDRHILPSYDQSQYIYKQIVQADTETRVVFDCMSYDGVVGKALTVKQFPDEVSITDALTFIGDLSKNEVQITCPFIVTLNIFRYGDKLKTDQERKAEFLYKQKLASSMSVKLSKKQEEAQWIIEKLVDGNKLLKGYLVWWLYHDKYDIINKNAQTLKNLLDIKGYKLQEEIKSMNLALFLYGALPGGASFEADSILLKRTKTMFDFNAAHLNPIQSDWKGTGTPVVYFISPRGQLMFLNFFDGSEGYNAIIAAMTGSGKSVLSQHIINSYYSLPFVSNIWVVDVGESYKNLCENLGGQYIDFNENMDFVINPFSDCEDLSEDMDLFISLIAKMAKPTENVSDTEKAVIEEAIRITFTKHAKATCIDYIIETLQQMAEESSDYPKKNAAIIISTNLFRWGSNGTYGKFFKGTNNLNLSNKFVVLELKNLSHREDLRNVVLMVLFYHISRVIYVDDDKSRKKILIFDEAWQFLDDQKIAKFINRAYRTFRKHGSSAITITQSINDFYVNEATQEMMFQASYWLLLKQKPESINLLRREEKVSLSDYEFQLLENIRTVKGKYSEIFIITPLGRGVARLIVPRFLYWVYSTDAAEVQIKRQMIAEHGFKGGIQKCIEIHG